MSRADVKFGDLDGLEVEAGKEQTFSFACPNARNKNGRCHGLVIVGRTSLKHDPNGQNDGIAQWTWDGNREKPTFSPSINCGSCWHGFIENGECVDVSKQPEPEPAR